MHHPCTAAITGTPGVQEIGLPGMSGTSRSKMGPSSEPSPVLVLVLVEAAAVVVAWSVVDLCTDLFKEQV